MSLSSIWYAGIDNRNEYFTRYLKLIKETIENDNKEIDEQSIAYGIAEDILDELIKEGYNPFGDVSDAYWEVQQLSELLYSSYLMSVFVFIESEVSLFCRIIKETHKQIFSHTDLAGSKGISNSVKYIEKVLEVNFPKDPTFKNHFEVFRLIRNVFVHNNGKINDDSNSNKIKKYIEENPDYLSLRFKNIIIHHQYAEFLIKLNQNICDEMVSYKKSIEQNHSAK